MATSSNKGFLLGGLFALLELEGVVEPSQYSAASMHPASVFVPGIARLAESGRSQVIMEMMKQLPMDALDDQEFSAEDQSGFPVGYYQQKARGLRMSSQVVEEEEQFSAHLLLRLEPSLKEWTMQRGGSKFVRSLLRAQRISELNDGK